MQSIFYGTGVALITPFYQNKIDFLSMKNLINIVISQGAKAIVVLATTGEGSTISVNERKEIITFCKSVISNRAKLIVGTGHNNFSCCVELTNQAKLLGADAVLVVTPYYNKTTQQGLVEFYSRLDKQNIPIIMYNVPARTGLNMEVETIKTIISKCKNIVGLKESTTDINRITKLMQVCKNKIAVYSGEDALNYVFYTLGGAGSISVTANSLCAQVENVFTLCKQQKFESALNIQNNLTKINQLMFCETNPVPIKQLLFDQGIISSPSVRLPLVELSKQNKQKIKKLADEISLKNLSSLNNSIN